MAACTMLDRDLHHVCWIVVDDRKCSPECTTGLATIFSAHAFPFLSVAQIPPSVFAGFKHTCALQADGKLICFGDNEEGQCDVPADVGPVTSVAAGSGHTCALQADGKLICFGMNTDGQCDVPADLGPVTGVAAGIWHTCALHADGKLACFGANRRGQCDVPWFSNPLMRVPALVRVNLRSSVKQQQGIVEASGMSMNGCASAAVGAQQFSNTSAAAIAAPPAAAPGPSQPAWRTAMLARIAARRAAQGSEAGSPPAKRRRLRFKQPGP